MIINWGSALKPKYLSFVYGSEWDKEDFKMFKYSRTSLGWSMNVWRLSISYDNFENVK